MKVKKSLKKIKTYDELGTDQQLLCERLLPYLDKEFNSKEYWIDFYRRGNIYLTYEDFDEDNTADAIVYLDEDLNIVLEFRCSKNKYIIASNDEIMSDDFEINLDELFYYE